MKSAIKILNKKIKSINNLIFSNSKNNNEKKNLCFGRVCKKMVARIIIRYLFLFTLLSIVDTLPTADDIRFLLSLSQ